MWILDQWVEKSNFIEIFCFLSWNNIWKCEFKYENDNNVLIKSDANYLLLIELNRWVSITILEEKETIYKKEILQRGLESPSLCLEHSMIIIAPLEIATIK